MAAALVAYARYLDADMVGTDSLVAVRGARITSWPDFVSLWLTPLNASTSFAETQAVFYRPLATLVFSADYAIWGANHAGYHLTNALIQAGVVALAFGMMRALGLSRLAAVCGAALIGFHPSMATAVPVVARRYDALSVAGLFACVLLLCRAVDASGGRARFLSVASAAALGAALLCKESAFAFVPLLPLVMFARAQRPSGRTYVVTLAPHALVAASVFVVRYALLGTLGGHSGSTFEAGFDWGGYEIMLGRYFGFLIWPFDGLLPSNLRGAAILALLVGVLVTVTAIALPIRYRRLWLLGVVWVVWFGVFFTALLHMSGPWYMYYPLGGVAVALGALIDGLAQLIRARSVRGVPVAVALAGALVYVVAALPASPLIYDYQQWHAAGAVTRRVLTDAADCIEQLGPGETITFWNLPRDYLDGTRETEFLAVTMLEGFSMEAYLHLLRPGARHPMFVGSSLRLDGPVPDLEARCERPGRDRLRLVATGGSLPMPELPPFDPGFGGGSGHGNAAGGPA
jgi:hypothetical protein